MNSFKTKAGTELELMNLKGKQYLTVANRLVWFREEKPLWGIETSYLKIEEDFSIARAEIKDETGRIIATATKREDARHFADHMEKCETGAIGRALALVGYGTQFAEELDEGERIVDSPQALKGVTRTVVQKSTGPATLRLPEGMTADPGEYVIQFGQKFKDKKIKDLDIYELANWCSFMEKKLKGDSDPAPAVVEAVKMAEAFLATRDRSMQAK